MSAKHTPGPLVCWQRDGTPKLAHPLTAADRAVTELAHSAEMLDEALELLEQAADNIEYRDEGAAHNLRRMADRCRAQAKDARAAIAKATGSAS